MVTTERLETRRLFSGSAISPTLSAAYEALIHDNARLKADLKLYTTALKADEKVLAKEVKALGKNTTNNSLLTQTARDAAKVFSADTADTNKYVSIANAEAKKAELAVAAFSSKPNLANGHKYVAAIDACDLLENASDDPRFIPLIQEAGDAADDLMVAISNLGADNPAATQLGGTFTALGDDISNLSNIQGGDADDAQAAFQTLLLA
jgi:hypothetical protein